MHADLDTLCTFVYCTADDLLPEGKTNARRKTTDAEIVTLAVAQAIMGIPSDRRFLKRARASLSHLFPCVPAQPGYYKRRRRLGSYVRWLLTFFCEQSPGFYDDLLLIDSTPIECARSRETVLRSALSDICDYGYCASHSRYFWGVRLHAIFALDGTPRAFVLTSPKRDEREVGLELLGSWEREEGVLLLLLSDKGYAGQEFTSAAAGLGVLHVRPTRKDEPGKGPHLAPIRQRIESIFWTCKDMLTFERHGARSVSGLVERIMQRFLCLAACICLNHQLGRPSRALVDYFA
jgi:hypothetical protein